MTFRITGTVPAEGGPRFTPEAVASMVGKTVPLHFDFRWNERLGAVTVTGASIEAGTGDIRLTIEYDEKTDRRLRERGHSRKSLKTLSFGGTVEDRTDDGTVAAFTLCEVCPWADLRSAPRIGPRG
jgi:hypothetical protein